MKKWLLCLTCLNFGGLCAAENESSESQESSAADQIIETIAEAAVSNPDYGKDLGDK